MSKSKESAVDLAKFIDKGVRVKLAGGREGTRRRRASHLSTASGDARCLESTKDTAPICVSLQAVSGALKGYDPLLNLVLDETVEYLRGLLQAGWCLNPRPLKRQCRVCCSADYLAIMNVLCAYSMQSMLAGHIGHKALQMVLGSQDALPMCACVP
jgi:small nuclear ribonucleoprotein (snRNP)-like protein